MAQVNTATVTNVAVGHEPGHNISRSSSHKQTELLLFLFGQTPASCRDRRAACKESSSFNRYYVTLRGFGLMFCLSGSFRFRPCEVRSLADSGLCGRPPSRWRGARLGRTFSVTIMEKQTAESRGSETILFFFLLLFLKKKEKKRRTLLLKGRESQLQFISLDYSLSVSAASRLAGWLGIFPLSTK